MYSGCSVQFGNCRIWYSKLAGGKINYFMGRQAEILYQSSCIVGEDCPHRDRCILELSVICLGFVGHFLKVSPLKVHVVIKTLIKYLYCF